MTSELIIAIVAGLMGMFGWGFSDFFAKITIDKIGDIPSLVWAHMLGGLMVILLLTGQFLNKGSIDLPANFSEVALIVGFGWLQAMVYMLVYRAFAKGKLAVLNPIFSSFPGIVALISIVFLGEVLTGSLAIGIILLFIGVLLINVDIEGLKEKKIQIARHPGVPEIVAGTVLAGIWTVGWSQFIDGKEWSTYGGFMYLSMVLSLVIYALFQRTSLKIEDYSAWKFLIAIGATEILAYAGISYGFSASSFTSVIALISGAFALPVIFLSYVFLKERIHNLQRVGALVIISSIIIISLVR